MNKILLSVCITSILSSMSVAQVEPVESKPAFSGNISIANNYVWRGISMNRDTANKKQQKATIQGEINYDFANGFKVGIWGTNINSDQLDAPSSEFDFSASYSTEVDGVGYEIGMTAYTFPGQTDSNAEEIHIGTSYNGFGLTYYNSLDEEKDLPKYVEASYGMSVEGVDISASIGKSFEIDNDDDGYKMYGIGLSKTYEDVDYGINFTKISADNSTRNIDGENNTVFSISKPF